MLYKKGIKQMLLFYYFSLIKYNKKNIFVFVFFFFFNLKQLDILKNGPHLEVTSDSGQVLTPTSNLKQARLQRSFS